MGQYLAQKEYVAEAAVPRNQWFFIKVEIVEGDADNGRVKLWLKPQQGLPTNMLEVEGFTYHPEQPAAELDGFKDIHAIKLYTSGNLICALQSVQPPARLRVWWDNFALGSNWRPAAKPDRTNRASSAARDEALPRQPLQGVHILRTRGRELTAHVAAASMPSPFAQQIPQRRVLACKLHPLWV